MELQRRGALMGGSWMEARLDEPHSVQPLSPQGVTRLADDLFMKYLFWGEEGAWSASEDWRRERGGCEWAPAGGWHAWVLGCVQPPLSVGVSRQKYWSGLPLPAPGDLPNPGV